MIGLDNLQRKTAELSELLLYFAGDAPGDHSTYGALLTAHTLKYLFLTTLETYFVP